MTYNFPIETIKSVLHDQIDISRLIDNNPKFSDLSDDMIEQIIQEMGRFSVGELSHINHKADQEGAKLIDGNVITAAGFKEAFKKFSDNGWMGLTFPTKYGGQEMPFFLSAVLTESLNASCMSYALCVLLSLSGAKAILANASEEQKENLIPNIVSGKWTVSMNLTEPQAGSDLAEIKSTATRNDDGTYLIKGQKIFITFGDHDMAENIIHLVLARLPDAPKGIKGISLFIVPKYHINEDGTLGERNDAKVISIESKLGIHASPTCTMSYGENNECVGTLLGEEHSGIRNMFVMMNLARLDVGLQSVGISERALQCAEIYAEDRKQGKRSKADEKPVSINNHPDVKRQMLEMRALTNASRGLCYLTAMEYDLSQHGSDDEVKKIADAKVQFLTPLAKSFSSDMAVQVTSLAVQTHGGMGFIEETGVAQHFRDARITPIYEGTNGIQAMDFIGRKLSLLDGEFFNILFSEIDETIKGLEDSKNDHFAKFTKQLKDCKERAFEAKDLVLNCDNNDNKLFIANSLLSLFSLLYSGKILGDGLYKSKYQENDKDTQASIFFGENFIPTSFAYLEQIKSSLL